MWWYKVGLITELDVVLVCCYDCNAAYVFPPNGRLLAMPMTCRVCGATSEPFEADGADPA